MSIRIGTASWAAQSLVRSGQFYPPEVRTAEARLAYYAAQYPLVEVDASYYALPAPQMAQAWVERTPRDFVFNVKAFGLFTGHAAAVQALPADVRAALTPELRETGSVYERDLPAELVDVLWARFLQGIAPLEAAGKLGAVHCQFAPWVVNDQAGRARVARCAARLRGRAMAAEFRHASWFDGDATTRDTLAFEEDLGVSHVVVDGAQGLPNTVPPVWAVTRAPLAVLRLHGRNPAGWLPRGQGGARASGARFNHEYSHAELQAIAPAIRWLDAQAAQVHVVFNNNHQSQGQRNARTLAQVMGLASGDAARAL